MKKLLTSLLCVVMVVCFMPAMAWADVTPDAGATFDLAEAIDNAEAGGTVVLPSDVDLNQTVEIDKNLTLDLDGKTITSPASSWAIKVLGGQVEIKNGVIKGYRGITTGSAADASTVGKVTVSDLTIETSMRALQNNKGELTVVSGSYKCTGSDDNCTVFNNSKMEIKGGTFETDDTTDNDALIVNTGTDAHAEVSGGSITNPNGYGISSIFGSSVTISGNAAVKAKASALGGNNTAATEHFTVSGGTVESTDGPAIFFPSEGNLTISGGKIIGKTGIHAVMGTINITGGTIEGTATDSNIEADYLENGTGIRYDGSALLLVKNKYNKFATSPELTVSISGGNITGKEVVTVMDASEKTGFNQTFETIVSGGTFNKEVPNEYLAANTANYEKIDGKFVVAAVTADGKPDAANTPGYQWVQDENGKFVEQKIPYIPTTPTTQKPVIESADNATVTLSTDGTQATIKVADGYELVDVTVNGVSKGKVDTLTGLKTGDKIVVTTKKIDTTADEIAAVKATKLVARTEMSKAKGKKAVKVYWYAKDGSELNFDGYEVYRSLKRYEGFGTAPFFKTAKEKYYNTAIKKGTKYYYKVRAYKVIDGEKVYTDWSTKAWRTVK